MNKKIRHINRRIAKVNRRRQPKTFFYLIPLLLLLSAFAYVLPDHEATGFVAGEIPNETEEIYKENYEKTYGIQEEIREKEMESLKPV